MTSTIEENRRIALRLLEELFEGNLDAAEELVHPEFVNHEAPPGHPQGPEGLKDPGFRTGGRCATRRPSTGPSRSGS
jgi:hypothetical protein